MESKTITELNKINKDFYKTVFNDFDNSRNYFWAGWEKLLPFIKAINKPVLKVLDVGCGNGRFGEFLIKNSLKVEYTGLDNSAELLESAKTRLTTSPENTNSFHFHELDIVNDPDISILKDEQYDLVVSFGVFHHIPSFELRLQVVKKLQSILSEEGILAISLWQFTKSENLMNRAVPKSELNTHVNDPSQLESGDYLLDWKRGEMAVRYCHEVDEVEMKKLFDNANSREVHSYHADGKNGDLNLYGVLTSI